LVGCTYYENLDKSFHLEGPANDVVLFRSLLVERYHFPEKNVVTLSEEEGKKDARLLPTRANIERECKRLAALAREGDQVVVQMGGHGSRQPQEDKAAVVELDGFEKIFLPRDVGKWDGSVGAVPNAIRGAELGDWLRPIAEKKGRLWVLIDACHSGGGIRGVDEKVRQVPAEAAGGLNIPKEIIQKAEARAVQQADKPPIPAAESPLRLSARDNVVIIYACQPSEVTIEKRLPPDAADKKPYGLLTFTIWQTLTQAQQPLNYRQLAQGVQDQYVNWGRTYPTPLIEGKDQDRQILGTTVYPRQQLRLVPGDGGGPKLNAGEVQGLTEGTILAVFPPPGAAEPDKLLGHVKLARLGTLDSKIEPVAYKDGPVVKLADLPLSGRCEVVYADLGGNKLKLAVDPLDNVGKETPAETKRRLEAVLQNLVKENPGAFAVSADPGAADWILRSQGDKVYLLPAVGLSGGKPGAALPDLFGPYALDDKLAPTLRDHLGRINRTRNLTKVATSRAGRVADGDGVKVDLETWVYRDEDYTKGTQITWPDPNLTLHDQDRIIFKLHNTNRFKIDVTLLYVDSGYGIYCLYPQGGEINRLEPDATLSVKTIVGGNTAGLEHLVVIATKAVGAPVDFSCLAQPTLEKAKDVERSRGGPTSLSSPLGQLLSYNLYGEGSARGMVTVHVDEHAIALRTFHIRPERRK
jgi:hypothetical protein